MCGSLMCGLTVSEIRPPLTRVSGDRRTAELAGPRFRTTASPIVATARLGRTAAAGWSRVYYNLELAAVPDPAPPSTGTDLYAGAINLYKCTFASGGTTCTQGDWINLTHVYGCDPGPLGAPAHVHPDQHGLEFIVSSGKAVGSFAHEGGM